MKTRKAKQKQSKENKKIKKIKNKIKTFPRISHATQKPYHTRHAAAGSDKPNTHSPLSTSSKKTEKEKEKKPVPRIAHAAKEKKQAKHKAKQMDTCFSTMQF